MGDSLKQLAIRANISRSTIYSWTSGRIDPEWETLRRVASGLDMKLWELVREIEMEPHEVPTRAKEVRR